MLTVDIEIGLVGVWRSDTAMTKSVCSASLTQRGFVQWANTSKIVLVRHIRTNHFTRCRVELPFDSIFFLL